MTAVVVVAAAAADDGEVDVTPHKHGQFCQIWYQKKGKTMLFLTVPYIQAAVIKHPQRLSYST
jgi:hypothetical protein